MIKEVEKVKTLMLIIHEKLTEVGIIQEVHSFYEISLSSPDECEELKKCFHDSINQGMIHISRSKSDENVATLEPLEIPYLRQDTQEYPMVVSFHATLPFESIKAVPWNYGATTYVGDKPLVLEPNVTNIVGIRGMTRSGRVFTPEQPPRKIPETSKGKEISSSNTKIGPSKNAMPQEETGECLKIIKKSDYKMVDQLS